MKLTSYTNFAMLALQDATRAFMAVLDDLTLADIASNQGDLLARIAPLEKGIIAPVRSAK
jgi:Rrf2 family nitric oxide-sensitive transcriptional repressor